MNTRDARYSHCIWARFWGSGQRIVDYTWAHPNRDGSPDKRFSFNPKVPVILHGLLRLRFQETFQDDIAFSRYGVGKQFALALSEMGEAELQQWFEGIFLYVEEMQKAINEFADSERDLTALETLRRKTRGFHQSIRSLKCPPAASNAHRAIHIAWRLFEKGIADFLSSGKLDGFEETMTKFRQSSQIFATEAKKLRQLHHISL